VAKCRAAGVTPVMITGDHPGTAGAIAGRIGLLDGGEKRNLLTGDQLAALDDDSFASQVGSVAAYARTTGTEAAHHSCLAGAARGGGHDWRRCQRRARAATR
jgi:hypothetical protein